MGIKIKNLQTGEFEKFNIPALKGEKGEPGEIEPSEKVDYIGKQHSKLRDTMNANVDYIIKTAIGEFNYLDYEGQNITATDSIEGRSKSAILKGHTLVNIFQDMDYVWNNLTKQDSFNYNGDLIILNNGYRDGRYWNSVPKIPNIKSNTEYTMIFTKGSSPYVEFGTVDENGNPSALKRYTNAQKVKITSPNNGDLRVKFCIENPTSDKSVINLGKVMFIEGDYTNVDIPYFEGMKSVQMPVLKTTGKNLIDRNSVVLGSFVSGGGGYGSVVTIPQDRQRAYIIVPVKPNTTYHYKSIDVYGYLRCMKDLETEAGRLSSNAVSNSILTTDETNYLAINFRCVDAAITQLTQDIINGSNIILTEGNDVASYEPYKSNILTTNEEVELRKVGDVQDELNLSTGELTQRIGEIVLDGSESWIKHGAYSTDEMNVYWTYNKFIPSISKATEIVCDKLPVLNPTVPNSIRTNGEGGIFIGLPSEVNITSFLQSDPVTVHYKLATESIKTVDLSDNHVYSYKDVTHYDCSSAEGSLVPTLSVKVPTDTQLTIQEQKVTTQTLLIKNMDLQQSIKEVQAMNLAFNTALYNSFNSIREEVEDIKKHVSTNENLEGSF